MFGFGRRPIEKLDFLVAGAQKSGTTALNYYLKRHPYIALPIKKSCTSSTTTICLPAAMSLMNRCTKCFDRHAPVVSQARTLQFIFIGGQHCLEFGITTRR